MHLFRKYGARKLINVIFTWNIHLAYIFTPIYTVSILPIFRAEIHATNARQRYMFRANGAVTLRIEQSKKRIYLKIINWNNISKREIVGQNTQGKDFETISLFKQL